MLKLTIIHPQIKDAIVRHIRFEDIKDFLKEYYRDIDTPDSYRKGLAEIIRKSTEITIPCFDSSTSTVCSMTIHGRFLSNCLTIVEVTDLES